MAPALELWACPATARDELITLTEGVLPHEERGPPEPIEIAAAQRTGETIELEASSASPPGRRPDLDPGARPGADRARAPRRPATPPRRALAAGRGRAPHRPRGAARPSLRPARPRRWPSAPTGATPAPTARPSSSRTGGSRRATTPRCPGCSPRRGGPPGSRPRGPESRPTSREDRASLSLRVAAGPLRLHLFCQPTPAARLRAFVVRPAGRRSCPSGPTGTGRAATSTSTRRTSRTTGGGTATTSCHSTRSSSTLRGRPSTTPGGSTPTSSPMPPGWSGGCATMACGRWSG